MGRLQSNQRIQCVQLTFLKSVEMTTEEVSFLRDQVKRLNATLAKYQEKYPPINVDSGGVLNVEGPEAPWLVDKSLLSPLLTEYDTSVKDLTQRIEENKKDQSDLRFQLDKVLSENKRLTRELKECIQNQLEHVGGVDIPVGTDDVMLTNLQQQLDLALQEKESATEMWQSTLQEVERLERELQDQKNNPQWKIFEQQADQLKAQYFNAVADLNAEIGRLQEDLRKSKNETRSANLQVTELRKTLEDMKDQMMKQDFEKNDAIERGEVTENVVEHMRKEINELEAALSGAQKKIDQESTEKKLLEENLREMQKKSTEHEQREYEALMQVRESVQMVESAVIEKDQACIQEKQTKEENQRLQDAINKLLDEAGIRTREEVDNVKKQCNVKMERLVEEVYTLEMENSEKQAQLDRALREKKAVETELEKLYQEGVVQGHKDSGTYNEMNRRMCQAERERDEAVIKLESATNQLKRAENGFKQEKSQYVSQATQMKDRLTTLSREYEQLNEDRLKYLNEIDEMKRVIQSLKKEKEAVDRKFTREMSCIEKDQNLREREFVVKLQSIEDGHKHAMMELRQLLTSQQRMGAKWKEECHSITAKFEDKVTELRNENSRLKNRQQELMSLLEESRKKTMESEEMLSEYTRNIKRLEERVRDAEHRATLATKQVSGQLARERRILHERRLLRTELDKSKLETSRPASRNADPLALADLGLRSRHGSGSSPRDRDTFLTNGRGGSDLADIPNL